MDEGLGGLGLSHVFIPMFVWYKKVLFSLFASCLNLAYEIQRTFLSKLRRLGPKCQSVLLDKAGSNRIREKDDGSKTLELHLKGAYPWEECKCSQVLCRM